MTPLQAACLEAMELPRWALRGASGAAQGFTLITSPHGHWQVYATAADVAATLTHSPPMQLLRNILSAVGLDVAGAHFQSAQEASTPNTPVALAFVRSEVPSGWLALPPLSEMLTKPSLKRQAWELLRTLPSA